MVPFFRRLRNLTRPPARDRRPAPFRPGLEKLEDREVLSVSSSDFRVPTTTTSNQFEAVNASGRNGLSVVVWTHRFSSTDTDIRAQMYNANGTRRGGEIRVAFSRRNESAPAVAMDNFGDWKVAFVDQVSSTNRNVVVASFSSTGARRRTNLTVASTSKAEYDPGIAVNAGGDFVVSYTLNYSSSDQDVRARMYTDAGTFTRDLAVGTTSARDERNSSVARNSAGTFAVAYESSGDIYLRRYSSSGAALTNSPQVLALGTNSQLNPSVAIDDRGRTVVAWQEFISGDWDVRARTIANFGALGSTRVVRATGAHETAPSVAMDRSDGDFVVTYQVGSQVYVREFNASGTTKNSFPFFLGTRTGVASPSISIDGFDDYFVTYTERLSGNRRSP